MRQRSRRKRPLNRVALILALVLAGIGAALLLVYKQRFEKQVSGGRPVAVLVAREEIRLGAMVTEDNVAIRKIPEAYVEERHIRAEDASRIMSLRVSMPVRPNQTLLWSDLVTNSEHRRNLSSLVPKGLRAVRVKVQTTSSFQGLLRPGDRVDVLYTPYSDPKIRGQFTVILLQNVLVLAVGSDTGGDLSEGGRRQQRSFEQATLSVTIEDASILTHATNTGVLSLTLRNPADVTVNDDPARATSEQVLQRPKRQPVRRAPTGPKLPVPLN